MSKHTSTAFMEAISAYRKHTDEKIAKLEADNLELRHQLNIAKQSSVPPIQRRQTATTHIISRIEDLFQLVTAQHAEICSRLDILEAHHQFKPQPSKIIYAPGTMDDEF